MKAVLKAEAYLVCKVQILVGNKLELAEENRAVSYERGKALADEFSIQFFETSAASKTNVEEVGWTSFFTAKLWHQLAIVSVYISICSDL